jgi:hypothetical protein
LFLCLAGWSCAEQNPRSEDPEASASLEADDDDLGFTMSGQSSQVQTKISKTVRPPLSTGSTTAKFKFSCTAGRCTYKCKLDSSAWKKCRSPKTYIDLLAGIHAFKVKATDSNGNSDPSPAKYSWTIVPSNFWKTDTIFQNLPEARADHSTVWTGPQMIIWGGASGSTALNTGGIYVP